MTSAAGLGAVLALYFGLTGLTPLALPFFAIAGALAAACILYFLSRSGAGVVALILAGVALASFATALMALALSLSANPYAMSEMVLWMMGSLKDRTLNDLAYALPLIAARARASAKHRARIGRADAGRRRRQKSGYRCGERSRAGCVGVALAVGAATAAAGAVSFVGLVVPHLLRPFVGHQPARLIVPSAHRRRCSADGVGYSGAPIGPSEQLLLGVVTAMLGAPFFFWLILRLRREP